MLSHREKAFLAGSAEFQKLLAEDSFLNAMESSADDRTDELRQVLTLAGRPGQIGTLKVRPLTAGLWSFLWCVGNSYTLDMKKISEADTDYFLYLLCRNDLKFSAVELKDLHLESRGWCRKFGIEYPDAAAFLMQIIYDSFFPLSLKPSANAESQEADWGCVWLTQYGCIAAQESGKSIEYCMFEMPLQLGLYCVINAFRKQDSQGLIHKRTDRADAEIIGQYVEKLGRDFIDRLGGEKSISSSAARKCKLL